MSGGSGGAERVILLVDDEQGVRFGVREFLTASGFGVVEAATCQAAQEQFRDHQPDLVIADYRLPDGNALDLLARLKRTDATVPVVILTGHGSIDLAVNAIKQGAEHFLTKPVDLATLLVLIERVLDDHRNRQRSAAETRQRAPIDPFLGASAAMRALAEQARRVLFADSPLLILGETGTGKGVLARWFHANGPRAAEPFVDLNCAGLTREFLESELFGHERGAFTGAVTTKPGLLEVAHRGSVFLDEIGDVDATVQPKLLKVLEEKRFRRLGDVRDRQVNVRLLFATHQDLPRLVHENKFRSDLYFRISTIPLTIPPLRDRRDDIAPLARQLVKQLAADLGRREITIHPGAEAALVAHRWPGNIRELRNVLERAILLGDTDELRPEHIMLGSPVGPAAADSNATLEELERAHIARVLGEEQGRVEEAARRLGIPRSSLYQKIKRYQLRGE